MQDSTALQVTLKALLSVLKGDGLLHLIRGHPDLTQRKPGSLVEICYKSESDAGGQAYAYGQACSTPPCSCRPIDDIAKICQQTQALHCHSVAGTENGRLHATCMLTWHTLYAFTEMHSTEVLICMHVAQVSCVHGS